jgi:hypothetical protein
LLLPKPSWFQKIKNSISIKKSTQRTAVQNNAFDASNRFLFDFDFFGQIARQLKSTLPPPTWMKLKK